MIPILYDRENLAVSSVSPSTVHVKNTQLTAFFRRYLTQELISVFEWNLPQDWDTSYFQYTLYMCGFIAVLETDKYGVICQHGAPSGRGIFYQPVNIIISNPLLKGIMKPRIGEECEVIKMQPDWCGAYDLISYYADMMAISAESAGINMFNSQLAYILAAANTAQAESMKKMFDQIHSGNPAVTVDKNLFDDEGNPNWFIFNQNLMQTYIADKIIADLHRWKNLFLTEIGIPNSNFQKNERMITNEVNANNTETRSKAELWLATMREGTEKVNKMFGLDLSVKFRFETEQQEVIDNDSKDNNSRTVDK